MTKMATTKSITTSATNDDDASSDSALEIGTNAADVNYKPQDDDDDNDDKAESLAPIKNVSEVFAHNDADDDGVGAEDEADDEQNDETNDADADADERTPSSKKNRKHSSKASTSSGSAVGRQFIPKKQKPRSKAQRTNEPTTTKRVPFDLKLVTRDVKLDAW